MKNIALGPRTVADIDAQVEKIMVGLGHPEPPLDLRLVRELLTLDKQYYSTSDDGFIKEVKSRLKIAGKQVLERPMLLKDAIAKLSLKALYLPDSKRILIDNDVPQLKHRWSEAHEVGHSIIPWHEDILFGDNVHTLTPHCHDALEAEANYAAGRLLFMADQFVQEALSSEPSIQFIRSLASRYGNTITSTLWRYVEQAENGRPMVALVTGHPHPAKRSEHFDPAKPCRYFIQSPLFRANFSRLTETDLFGMIVAYCGPQRGGSLGESEIVLVNDDGQAHNFYFETFFNGYEALSLGYWKSARASAMAA